MTKYIYGYFEDINDLRVSTVAKWERSLTYSAAQSYLRNHLLKSLRDDFPPALQAFRRRNVGFFALPRIIFPYITFLGALYKGADESKNALKFMSDYLGRVAPEYKDLAGIYYVGYRHGLMHTNMPKLFRFRGRNLGWWISYAPAGGANRRDFLNNNLLLYPEMLYSDVCRAINLYILDFDDKRKRTRLLNNFKRGFKEMAKINLVKDIAGKTSRKFLRKSLKSI